jgi:hypothetical protein
MKEDSMATRQKQSSQRPSESEQPKRQRNSTSGRQRATRSQAEAPDPPQQEPPSRAEEGQALGTDQGFDQLLEQQIAQAIQPVLDEFRRQVAEVMEQQMAERPTIDTSSEGDGQESQQVPGSQQQDARPADQQPTSQAPPPQTEEQSPSAAAQQMQAEPPQQAEPAASDGQPAKQPESQEQRAPQRQLVKAVRPALEVVEHQGERFLQSLLVAGTTALLAESTRVAAQQRAEQGLHGLLQKMFEGLPDQVSSQDLQAQTERTLQAILRESLDAVFAEGMRLTLQQQGGQAMKVSLDGDFGALLKKTEDTLKAIADALVAVLRRHWQPVLRLLLLIVLSALESSLEHSGKESKAAS